MARYINECSLILRNLSQELRSRCPTDDQYCCYLHCCFVNRQHKEVWETWYFWFGVALVALLIFTSATSFLVGMCTRKRHQLIRVHHQTVAAVAAAAAAAAAEGGEAPGMASSVPDGGLAASAAPAAPVTAITGPDGLIQPYVVGGLPAEVAARYKTQGPQGTATAIFCRHSREDSLGGAAEGEGESAPDAEQAVDDADLEDVAGPLEPAYPPMQPVTIVRGSLPEGGYRQTDTYTELVLPPGYVDPRPGHKHQHRP